MRPEQREIALDCELSLSSGDPALGRVPIRGVRQRPVVALDGVEPLQNRRTLAIDIVDRLEPVVVGHHCMLVPFEAFFEHVGSGCRIIQHPLDEEMDVPFENLQLA